MLISQIPLNRTILGLLTTSAVMVFLVAEARAASFTMTSTPSFTRAFTAPGLDYAVNCPSGYINLTLSTPSGTYAYINGKRVKTGRTTTKTSLTPGKRAKVSVKASGKTTEYSVRCVPNDFPKWTSTGALPAAASFLGLSVSYAGNWVIPYAIITDGRGVPVWWKHLPDVSAMDVKVVGGRVGTWTGDLKNESAGAPYSLFNLDGTKYRDINVVGGRGDAHEALANESGNWYRIAVITRDHVDLSSLGGPVDRAILDQQIQEIDPSGQVVWSWSTTDHISLAETGRWFPLLNLVTAPGTPIDMIHLNSIAEDSSGGIIVSARHLDAVYRINKADGSITWKLGGTTTAQSLSVIGDPFSTPFAGQHDARPQPDGTITVYDNGSGYDNRTARALRWSVDAGAKTATLVERLTDPTINLTSAAGGGARRLSDGSWIVSWCSYPYIRAYSPAHAKVFDMKFAGAGRSYRAIPISTSQVTRAQLVAGMDAQAAR